MSVNYRKNAFYVLSVGCKFNALLQKLMNAYLLHLVIFPYSFGIYVITQKNEFTRAIVAKLQDCLLCKRVSTPVELLCSLWTFHEEKYEPYLSIWAEYHYYFSTRITLELVSYQIL